MSLLKPNPFVFSLFCYTFNDKPIYLNYSKLFMIPVCFRPPCCVIDKTAYVFRKVGAPGIHIVPAIEKTHNNF